MSRIKLEATRLQNEDLLPTPPDKCVWGWLDFFMYWFSEAWAVSTWTLGSSLMTTGGLKVHEAIIIMFFANVIISLIIVANGRAASVYHIGFPVLSRVSFGINGAYLVVAMRAILGVVWASVQMFYLGQFVCVILRTIFPSFWHLKNKIPSSQYVTVQEITGFFLAFVCMLPFMFVPQYKIRHLFKVKGFFIPLAGMGIVIWACNVNKGVGRTDLLVDPTVRQSGTTVFAFSVLSQINSIFGASSALIVTVPDIARYAKNTRAQLIGQVLALPVAYTICGSFGIISTSALYEYYGKQFWNPYEMLQGILDDSYTAKSRAGCFFAALAFAFATLGTCIACNTVPFAADVTCLLPKYINLVRGQVLCLVISLGIVPWRIMRDSTTFLNFLSGYSIFEGPVVAITVADYALRMGYIDFDSLYMNGSGYYQYWKGINFRAICAFVAGFILPFPGFCLVLAGSEDSSVGAARLFDLGYILSVVIGGLSYCLICLSLRLRIKNVERGMVSISGKSTDIDGTALPSDPSDPSHDAKNKFVAWNRL